MPATQYHKKYKENNPEKFKQWSKNFYKTDRGRKVKREMAQRRRLRDPQFRMKERMRNMIYRFLKDVKSKRSQKYLGCSFEEFKQHLESKFEPGMTWENWGRGHGKWNIDHIKPSTLFDASDESQQMICCHYLNLRPLWFEDNIKKSDIYDWNAEHETLLSTIHIN